MADGQRLGERYWLTPKGEAAAAGRDYDPVKEFKAATAAASASPSDTAIHHMAVSLVQTLGAELVTYHYPCTICGAAQEHTVTVATAATYVEWPRGICGKHDPDNGHDAVLVVT